MKNLFLAALLMLVGAGAARALDPKVIETDWNWQIAQTACTGVTSCVFDVAGLGAGVSVSTNNIVGFKFSILPVGASAKFTVSQVARTFGPTAGPAAASTSGFNDSGHPTLWGGTAPTISTSTAITIPAGVNMGDAYTGTFEALTVNPYFTLSSLSTAATTYITVEYGTKRSTN